MKWSLRVVTGIVFFLLIAGCVLWLLGKRPGHGTFEVSTVIKRPLSAVYSALIDDEMTKKWVSGVVTIKELTPNSPLQVGSKILITEKVSGRPVIMEEEITYLKPPYVKKYTARGLGDPITRFTEFGEYQLEERDGQTKFIMRSRVEYEGFIYRLLEPILTQSIKRKFESDQKRLKAIMEA